MGRQLKGVCSLWLGSAQWDVELRSLTRSWRTMFIHAGRKEGVGMCTKRMICRVWYGGCGVGVWYYHGMRDVGAGSVDDAGHGGVCEYWFGLCWMYKPFL